MNREHVIFILALISPRIIVAQSHIVLCEQHHTCQSVKAVEELNFAISESINVCHGGWTFFRPLSKYKEHLLMPSVSWMWPENAVLFVFGASANSSADTREALVSKDDGPCARGIFKHKAAKAVSGQRPQCAYHIPSSSSSSNPQSRREADRELVSGDRQRISLINTSSHFW